MSDLDSGPAGGRGPNKTKLALDALGDTMRDAQKLGPVLRKAFEDLHAACDTAGRYGLPQMPHFDDDVLLAAAWTVFLNEISGRWDTSAGRLEPPGMMHEDQITSRVTRT